MKTPTTTAPARTALAATAPTTTTRATSRAVAPGLGRALLTATAIGLSLGLAACGPTGSAAPGPSESGAADPTAGAAADPGGSETGDAAAEASDAAPLVWEDGWVKAAEEGMTGAFGTLRNPTDSDLRITGAESAAAGSAELHETASDDGGSTMMQEKEGGFLVPAGGSLSLEPGGDHVMLMDLQEPILSGDEVTITLLTDGGEVETTVVAKEFTGAQEEYVQDHGH